MSAPEPPSKTTRRLKLAWLVYGLPLVVLGTAYLLTSSPGGSDRWLLPVSGVVAIAMGLLLWIENRTVKIFGLGLWGLVFFLWFPLGSFFPAFAIIALVASLKENRQPSAEEVAMMPADEIKALVESTADEALGIRGSQIHRTIDELKIPAGDFKGFLDDLAIDYGLEIPGHVRNTSVSLAEVIAALQEHARKKASERLY